MSDFHQQGVISTLHSLHDIYEAERYLQSLEDKLEAYSQQNAIALLLPCLYSEIEAEEAIGRIVCEIQKVRYVREIVVVLGGTEDKAEFNKGRELFGSLDGPNCTLKVIWILGPRIQAIFRELRDRGLFTGTHGKGQAVWLGLGYIFARRNSEVIALHDCDIVTYHRLLLGRLIEPIVNPHKDFLFCKGFYTRISPSEKVMKGRVTRLFLMPFVDTMAGIMGERGMYKLERFFLYKRAFKYPLAGEFSLTSNLARAIGIANDWGLEVSTLSEIYERVTLRKVAQIDLDCNYEHKHQDLSPEDSRQGLHRMVVDIAKFYLKYLCSHGVCLDDNFVRMIQQTYYQNALRFVKIYADDAETNRLNFNRHEEETSVGYFTRFLWEAWEAFQESSDESLIPSWNRVIHTLPDIYTRLVEAVEADNC